MPPERRLAEALSQTLVLGALLEELRCRFGTFRILDHWQQGEFHHDILLEVDAPEEGMGKRVVLVATNCNGGVKEVLVLDGVPERGGLWHARCPENPDFAGTMPNVLACSRTAHWFDPRELLVPTARSEYKDSHRERQCGGGWMLRRPAA